MTDNRKPILEVKNLKKYFPITQGMLRRHVGDVKAVDDVSFVIYEGETLGIVGMGLAAFAFGTAGGVLLGKLMYLLTGGKVNPLIGSAGVSAVPMAARV